MWFCTSCGYSTIAILLVHTRKSDIPLCIFWVSFSIGDWCDLWYEEQSHQEEWFPKEKATNLVHIPLIRKAFIVFTFFVSYGEGFERVLGSQRCFTSKSELFCHQRKSSVTCPDVTIFILCPSSGVKQSFFILWHALVGSLSRRAIFCTYEPQEKQGPIPRPYNLKRKTLLPSPGDSTLRVFHAEYPGSKTPSIHQS